MADYTTLLKTSIGYESLKSAYLQKFPALSQESTEKAILEDAPGESCSDDNHEELNKDYVNSDYTYNFQLLTPNFTSTSKFSFKLKFLIPTLTLNFKLQPQLQTLT